MEKKFLEQKNQRASIFLKHFMKEAARNFPDPVVSVDTYAPTASIEAWPSIDNQEDVYIFNHKSGRRMAVRDKKDIAELMQSFEVGENIEEFCNKFSLTFCSNVVLIPQAN